MLMVVSSDGVDGGDPGVPNDSDEFKHVAHCDSAIPKLLLAQIAKLLVTAGGFQADS